MSTTELSEILDTSVCIQPAIIRSRTYPECMLGDKYDKGQNVRTLHRDKSDQRPGSVGAGPVPRQWTGRPCSSWTGLCGGGEHLADHVSKGVFTCPRCVCPQGRRWGGSSLKTTQTRFDIPSHQPFNTISHYYVMLMIIHETQLYYLSSGSDRRLFRLFPGSASPSTWTGTHTHTLHSLSWPPGATPLVV